MVNCDSLGMVLENRPCIGVIRDSRAQGRHTQTWHCGALRHRDQLLRMAVATLSYRIAVMECSDICGKALQVWRCGTAYPSQQWLFLSPSRGIFIK
ncbi:hypothetical protein AUEXF2481DRAFT_580505 [Aureobasidium subglaciale EXF-2481]|uniref:Carbohydrate-binding module family 13 protein n=1 Tax=Aureobasidium subglaciale (strain EXF-2481) TaxID=1043005 RepID=A0A074YH92_AURSE|nr:uncharacterized protein AUEXF2481DRAFT_580505 [Aureobasidium subglaciale EXF-2481]KEQ97153.1 hypothetical protein AUEXF2481DRAFT_580505 [Aureobasidium subglaciale EXF-2481]